MGKPPVLKPGEVVNLLERLGFREVRQRGSHKQFQHADGRTTTVPFHSGRDISPSLLRQIARDVGLSIWVDTPLTAVILFTVTHRNRRRMVGQGDVIPTVATVYWAMPFNLPLEQMTIQEKLAAMESLWEDLTRTPEAIESPIWHKDILDERRTRLAEGQSRFIDWETAKADIRKTLS